MQGTYRIARYIEENGIHSLILAGFTAGECIDATARDSCELKIETYVVGEAVATFDQVGPDGKVHRAERIHRLVLSHLDAFVAEVLELDSLLNEIEGLEDPR